MNTKIFSVNQTRFVVTHLGKHNYEVTIMGRRIKRRSINCANKHRDVLMEVINELGMERLIDKSTWCWPADGIQEVKI